MGLHCTSTTRLPRRSLWRRRAALPPFRPEQNGHNPIHIKEIRIAMPQDQDQSYQIILSPEFASAIASCDEARNADRIAAGLPPFQHKSPFTTQAQIEKEEKNARRREKRARAHDTAAAKAQIAARCQSNPSFERHARKCAICNHPDCDSIESDFVN